MHSRLEVLASERFNAVKISYVEITALSNESQREISSMERNIGRAQTTEVANAIKSAPCSVDRKFNGSYSHFAFGNERSPL